MNIGAAVVPDAAFSFYHFNDSRYCLVVKAWCRYCHRHPLAAAGQINHCVRTVTVAFQHAADKAALNGNLTAIGFIHISALLLQAMRIAIPALIVAISVGTSSTTNVGFYPASCY